MEYSNCKKGRNTFLRSDIIYPSLDEAKLALSRYAEANYLLDGEPIIAKYTNNGTVKVVLGICTVTETSSNGCVLSEKLTFFIDEETILGFFANVAYTGEAADVHYDNTLSGLESVNVQDVIDELYEKIRNHEGKTTVDINYESLFKEVNEGGLGYTEQGTNGTGFGWLKKGTFGEGYIIKAGTPYDTIFEKIFDGTNFNADDQSLTYDGSPLEYTGSCTPTGYTMKYGSSPETAESTFTKTDAGNWDFNAYFFLDNVLKGTASATLTINNKEITISPNAKSASYDIGDVLQYDTPSITQDSPITQSDIEQMSYTYPENTLLSDVGTFSTQVNSETLNTLDDKYANYSFVSADVTFTVNPIIRFKKSTQDVFVNYYKTISEMNDDADMQVAGYDSINVMPESGLYMFPLVHRETTDSTAPFQLQIVGYVIKDIYYWDTQNLAWKHDTGIYDYFGTPVQTTLDNGLIQYTYTFTKNTNTDSALAIFIKK